LNKITAFDEELFIKFIRESQPLSWKRLEEEYNSDVSFQIIRRLIDESESEGIIHVLRNGFKVSGIHLDCVYFKPVSKNNPEHEILYNKNILSAIRQARYSIRNPHYAIDLLLSINGLPVTTAELKNPATKQTFNDAIAQYKQDRDPNEKLFDFKKRTLVHFAVDPFEVHMTTRLAGEKTNFLPFNRGRPNGGKGNPDPENDSYPTSYLWERIWQKDIWLEIFNNFIAIEKEKDPESGVVVKESIIFPRYHQLEDVLNLVKATQRDGVGTNYLNQHSTGSGKSKTIAWLAYQLFSLHDVKDKPIFDGILVLSDRNNIVNQLADTIQQIEQTPGVVEEVENSSELADLLEKERKILVSTQQKFPFVLDKISKVKGRNYAVIIDEAHSSQTGKGTDAKVKQVLATNLEEAAQEEQEREKATQDLVDKIEENRRLRGHQKNLSYYAFTATPKKKTLVIFGTKVSKNEYVPFHVYSMKQAIQEGFILDVLRNYVTHEGLANLVRTTPEDKVVEGRRASRYLKKYVNTHHLNLSQKAELIVEHFISHTKNKIGGVARAMVVASSRHQALRYKQEIDAYIELKGYKELRTLVAFSGSLQDPDNNNVYTEYSVNETRTDRELIEKFKKPYYRILVVADKYQTGYDEPLLHTMYVDKKLYGIKAVQTLSRLNRTHIGKTDTFVMDFQNSVEDIKKAFEDYYVGTPLIADVDLAFVLNLYREIMQYNVITHDEMNRFADVFFKPRSQQTTADHGKLYGIVTPILNRYDDATDIVQDEFKMKVVKYIEAHSFLTLMMDFEKVELEPKEGDRSLRQDIVELEKLFVIAGFVAGNNLLKGIVHDLPELKGDVSLQWYRIEKTFEGSIDLKGRDSPIEVKPDQLGMVKTPDEITTLSAVIREFNEKFGGNAGLTGADTIAIEEWLQDLENDQELREIALRNDFDDFLREYEKRFLNIVLVSLTDNKDIVTKVFSDAKLKERIVRTAASYYHRQAKANSLPPIRPDNPIENKRQFRLAIESCKGFIHWLDLYVGTEGLEFVVESCDKNNIKNIKILTSMHNNEYQITDRLHNRFLEIQKELSRKGISMEMKLVSTKDAYDHVAHDRFILGENVKFNVPSFSTVVKGRLSEIKKTTIDVPFEGYWNNKDSLDLVRDWPKIRDIIGNIRTKRLYEGICSECGKNTQFPFKPDGIRPAYCDDCKQKHRI